MSSRKKVSYPIEGYTKNDLLSYYVFYKDDPSITLVNGTPVTDGKRYLNYMTGVVFADNAKAEIVRLRSELREAYLEIEALKERLFEEFKYRYGRS